MAVPKTGSTSVQKFLLENDKTATKNGAEIEGKFYRFREHMTASGIKTVLGIKYEDYTVIGFVRHPYGRIVSSYFFYRKGAKSWAWEGRESKKPTEQKLKIKLAQLLPFHIWALVYPYKSNIEYFFDAKNNLIVDLQNIGLFEDLEENLNEILSRSNIRLEKEIPHENKSLHVGEDEYFNNYIFKRLIDLKVKRDLEFYNMVVSKKQ
jgi:hypothetical protein